MHSQRYGAGKSTEYEDSKVRTLHRGWHWKDKACNFYCIANTKRGCW